VSDRAFTGRDVAEAVAAAGRALGVPAERLRYVILEAGSPGGHGIGGTPARIAVLVEASRERPPAASVEPPRRADGGGPRGGPRAGDEAPRALELAPVLRGLVRSLAEAAGVDLGAELEETEDVLTVRLEGPGCALLLEEEGEVLQSLEHLLQRVAARPGPRPRVVVACPGYRETRDESLRAEARALVQAVRSDGRPRESRPLNSYERRIIHVVVSEEPGLRTFSVGEGADRRVTVALADPEAAG
jgi:spoIIIJ-associated protein